MMNKIHLVFGDPQPAPPAQTKSPLMKKIGEINLKEGEEPVWWNDTSDIIKITLPAKSSVVGLPIFYTNKNKQAKQ